MEKPFFPKLLAYMLSGPVVCMAWEGREAVAMGRKMLGATNPLESAPGTIRGDYSLEVCPNRFACDAVLCVAVVVVVVNLKEHQSQQAHL